MMTLQATLQAFTARLAKGDFRSRHAARIALAKGRMNVFDHARAAKAIESHFAGAAPAPSKPRRGKPRRGKAAGFAAVAPPPSPAPIPRPPSSRPALRLVRTAGDLEAPSGPVDILSCARAASEALGALSEAVGKDERVRPQWIRAADALSRIAVRAAELAGGAVAPSEAPASSPSLSS